MKVAYVLTATNYDQFVEWLRTIGIRAWVIGESVRIMNHPDTDYVIVPGWRVRYAPAESEVEFQVKQGTTWRSQYTFQISDPAERASSLPKE